MAIKLTVSEGQASTPSALAISCRDVRAAAGPPPATVDASSRRRGAVTHRQLVDILLRIDDAADRAGQIPSDVPILEKKPLLATTFRRSPLSWRR